MTPFRLVLEGFRDQQYATVDSIKEAVRRMARPGGPTYIVLQSLHGGYAQAAGCDDRYRIETRDTYGEGFRHWLAGSPHVKDRSDVVMYYRNRCKVHGFRKCPLLSWGENVLALRDVLAILLSYHASGERSGSYPWEEVTKYFLEEGLNGDKRLIREIRPRRRDG
jgi:hypothetical protein